MVNKKHVNRLEILHQKMLNKGISANKALRFDKKEWNQAFGAKIKKQDSLDAQKSLIRQLGKHREKVVTLSFKKRGINNEDYKDFIRKQTDKLYKPPERKKRPPQKPVYTWVVYERLAGRIEIKHEGYTEDRGLLEFFGQRDDRTSKGAKWRSQGIRGKLKNSNRVVKIPEGYLQKIYKLDIRSDFNEVFNAF